VLSAVLAVLGAPGAAAAGGAESTLYVDPGSTGGKCSDARLAAEVSQAAPWCSLGHALEAAPDGSLVLMRGGAYAEAEVRRRERSEFVTFRPFRREDVSLEGLSISDSSHMRFEGFTTRGLSISDSSHMRFEGFTIRGRTRIELCSRIQLVGNDIAREGITIRPSDRVLIEANRIHDLTYDGSAAGAGYGVALIGGWNDPDRPQKLTNVTVRGNRFSRIPADAIQAGPVENLLIEDNEFESVTPFLRSDEHSDGIQLHGHATNVTIRRNFFHDQPRALIAKRSVFRNLVVENNLMARLSGIALNIYDAPGARIVNNTIWDTTAALRFNDLPEVAAEMRGAIVTNNILDEVWIGPDHVAIEDHNVIGRRKARTHYGQHDVFGKPGFVSPYLLDYRLSRHSRAVDSGASQYAPRRDLERRRRIDIPGRRNRGSGSRSYIDRGALEYVATQADRPGAALNLLYDLGPRSVPAEQGLLGVLLSHVWRLLA
jgi:hypothetical protein